MSPADCGVVKMRAIRLGAWIANVTIIRGGEMHTLGGAASGRGWRRQLRSRLVKKIKAKGIVATSRLAGEGTKRSQDRHHCKSKGNVTVKVRSWY